MIEKAWDWNKVQSTYWDVPSEELFYYLQIWKEQHKMNLLDLGSGKGRHSFLFAKNGFNVTAFDISESGLNLMKEKMNKMNLMISLVNGNMISLPFQDATFDTIIAYNSIYHSDEDGFKTTVNEIKRILSNNGEAFITLLSKDDVSFNGNSENKISNNTLMKKEEDGSILPHYYVDNNDIETHFNDFHINSLRKVVEFHNDKSFSHYHLHLIKRGVKSGFSSLL